MTESMTYEERLLLGAERNLQAAMVKLSGPREEVRLQILEAAASRLGGFELAGFHEAFHIRSLAAPGRLMDAARGLVSAIDASSVPPALALSSLSRERLTKSSKREAGAYHTDFRLAQHLARSVGGPLRPGLNVLDPACGAGILLAALSIEACGSDRLLASEWLAQSVHASDLSAAALRSTLLALSSLTDSVDALHAMRLRWRVHDSLLASIESWADLAPDGFDVVVGNPPWEKVKLSRHEFVQRNGGQRHYGQAYVADDLLGYEVGRFGVMDRSGHLVRRYATLADGEPDLYVAFSELMVDLTKPGGRGAILVPGGLIRSKGTGALRRYLFKKSSDLSVTVMDNKARFFAIDSRFKFLVVNYEAALSPRAPRRAVRLCHGHVDASGVKATEPVVIGRGVLAKVRPDLTIPEVRSSAEWRLFLKMQRGGLAWADPDSPWHPHFCREVDMTHARPDFMRSSGANRLAVVEGRMVQPHRFGAKAYINGEGRAARWATLPPGASALRPQFWIGADRLSSSAKDRSFGVRAGFCDITGQTNERTMMAAIVPSGSICGNKVPTILFPNDRSEGRLRLWVAIVNSIPFDWLMRRVVTTTVNYFLLLSLRLPALQPDTLPGRRLIEIGERLSDLDSMGASSSEVSWTIARLRAEADVIVGRAYGVKVDDLRLMLQDFPLLDRGQPSVPGEGRSTVTTDLIMATWVGEHRPGARFWRDRVTSARAVGAVPYVPSEFTDGTAETRDAR